MTDLSQLGKKIGVTSPRVLRLSGVTAQLSDSEIDFEEEDLENEFSDGVSSVVSEEVQALSFEFPEDFQFNKMKEGLGCDIEVTEFQKHINEIVSGLDEERLKLFTKKLMLKLGIFMKNQIDEGDFTSHSKCLPEKKILAFLTDVHRYNTSTEYRMHCMELFENGKELVDEHMSVAYRIIAFVRTFYINLLKLGSVPTYRKKKLESSVSDVEPGSSVEGTTQRKSLGLFGMPTRQFGREIETSDSDNEDFGTGKGKKGKGKGKGRGRPIKKTRSTPETWQNDMTAEMVYTCPACNQEEDGRPMISCDICDGWFHWACVGITEELDSEMWFCEHCDNRQRKQTKGKGKVSKGEGKK